MSNYGIQVIGTLVHYYYLFLYLENFTIKSFKKSSEGFQCCWEMGKQALSFLNVGSLTFRIGKATWVHWSRPKLCVPFDSGILVLGISPADMQESM